MDEIELVIYRNGKVLRKSALYQTSLRFWERLLRVIAGQEIEIQDTKKNRARK